MPGTPTPPLTPVAERIGRLTRGVAPPPAISRPGAGAIRALLRSVGAALDMSGAANRDLLRTTQRRTDLDAMRGDLFRIGQDYRSSISRLAEQGPVDQQRAIERVHRETARRHAKQLETVAPSLRAAQASLAALHRIQARNQAAALAGTRNERAAE